MKTHVFMVFVILSEFTIPYNNLHSWFYWLYVTRFIMYGTEYFIICICCIIVSIFWETNNLSIAVIMIVGLAFNIASIIYKSIVYKKNDIRNIIEKCFILIGSIILFVGIILLFKKWEILMDIKHITHRIICFPRYYKKWKCKIFSISLKIWQVLFLKKKLWVN